LIKPFVDKDAEIIYVPFTEVLGKSKEENAIPFDLPGADIHTMASVRSTIIKKHNLSAPGTLTIPTSW
jgi:hypothetical protein